MSVWHDAENCTLVTCADF